MLKSQLDYQPHLREFLQQHLLPAIYKSGDADTEPMLLQVLDDLADTPHNRQFTLTKIFAYGKLHDVPHLVDSTSPLFQVLVSGDTSPEGFALLPEKYSTSQRLAVLKRHGLAHEGDGSERFFLHCVDQIQAQRSSMTTDRQKELARLLVQMLYNNVGVYHTCSCWPMKAKRLSE